MRTRRKLLLEGALVALGSLALALAAPAKAMADDDGEESPAVAANKGLHLGLGPVILFPTDGGPLGGGLLFDLRYGIEAGPTILGPGGRLAGYYISGRFVGIAMPTLRVTFPVGPFAPFLLGGVGGGWLSNPSESGVALLGGGGLMIHFGRHFAIGAEATYQTVLHTELQELAIGPAIVISF